MDSKQFGYMGLNQPYTQINSDGRKLTYYPSGKVQNQETGNTNIPQQTTQPINYYYTQKNNDALIILAMVSIVAITAMVLITKK